MFLGGTGMQEKHFKTIAASEITVSVYPCK